MTVELSAVDQDRWRDPTLSARERAQALVDQLTLEEKVAQLGSVWLTERADAFAPRLPDDLTDAVVDPFTYGIGQLTRVFGTAPISLREGVAKLRALQGRVTENQRLGIPALVHEECLTGLAARFAPSTTATAGTRSRTNATVSSVEPLSTTTVSMPATLSRHRSIHGSASYVTTTQAADPASPMFDRRVLRTNASRSSIGFSSVASSTPISLLWSRHCAGSSSMCRPQSVISGPWSVPSRE